MKDSYISSIIHDPAPFAISAAVVSSTFFALQNAFQRLAGCVGLTVARPAPFIGLVGLTVTASNLYISNHLWSQIEQKVIPPKRRYQAQSHVSRMSEGDRRIDAIGKILLGVSIYLALEGGFFRTTFPSSSIARGALANSRNMFFRSIKSSGPATTHRERTIIQSLGKKYGCHQCGSRQFRPFNPTFFIADHIPPTKMALKSESAIWRRVFGVKVNQRLWPQCQKCFQVQGSAVRQIKHIPIYHHGLRLFHAAPAFALLLAPIDDVRKWRDISAKSLISATQSLEHNVRKFIASM